MCDPDFSECLKNPMLGPSLKIWTAWGYLRPRDSRRYFLLIPSFLMFALELFYMLFSGKGIIALTIDTFYFAVHFNCLFRIITTLMHRERFENYLINFVRLYNTILSSAPEDAVKMLKGLSKRAAVFTVVNTVVGLLAVTSFSIYPLLLDGRNHPYGVYFLGVDFTLSPQYEIVYVWQILISFSACAMYIPFINMFISWIMFGMAMTTILKEMLRNIAHPFDESVDTNPNNALIAKRFRQCIEYHKRIIRYVEELNEIVSMICLVEIIMFGMLLVQLLFFVQIVERLSQFISGIIYTFIIMFQLLSLYWLSNEFSEESIQLSVACYDCPWYYFNTKNKETILLMMAVMQHPMQIMIGSFAPITLQTFQSILNVSYSYFALLRNSLL